MKVIFLNGQTTKEMDLNDIKSEKQLKEITKELLIKDSEKKETEVTGALINLLGMSQESWIKLDALDSSFIGTKDYMGITFFWSYEYRHYLRDVPYAVRKMIHNEFLDNNLNVSEDSDKHLAILEKHRELFRKTNKCW